MILSKEYYRSIKYGFNWNSDNELSKGLVSYMTDYTVAQNLLSESLQKFQLT